jgi:peptidyl-prolyl cis-trans isomerase-like protein 2
MIHSPFVHLRPIHRKLNIKARFPVWLTFTAMPFFSIVAIKTTGNVYSRDSVEQLNIKPGYWQDLQTEEPFTRADIITLQDPHNLEKRDLSKFDWVQRDTGGTDTGEPESSVNLAAMGGAGALLKSMQASKDKDKGKAKEEPRTVSCSRC